VVEPPSSSDTDNQAQSTATAAASAATCAHRTYIIIGLERLDLTKTMQQLRRRRMIHALKDGACLLVIARVDECFCLLKTFSCHTCLPPNRTR